MALLVNYLSKEKYFTIYLITISNILNEEYPIPNNTKRISLSEEKISIFEVIEREHLDILIYNFYIKGDMDKLNKLNTTKVIFYNHSSFLFWIYFGLNQLRQSLYQTYQNCKYVISLIPVENDYLFKKWGINSILMSNPSSFEYNSVTPSDLSNKNIIMIGRIDTFKRYELGVQAMEKIIKEIPECQMNIISDYYSSLNKLIKKLKLENNIRFTGYQKNIDIYLKNASLHIFPSISESYGLVLSEAKIYGIPTIMCGLDYLALADGGTVIIYDDNPETIAKEALKILKDDKYRKKLGKEARESMKNRKNILIAKRWVKLLLSVYKGDYKSYNKLTKGINDTLIKHQLLEGNLVQSEQKEEEVNSTYAKALLELEKISQMTQDEAKSVLMDKMLDSAKEDAAKEAQGHLESRIARLKGLIANSRIIDTGKLDTSSVQLLSRVTVLNTKNKAKMTYSIVPDTEANLKEGKIALSTPIAKGLLGKKVGDKVDIKVPAGIINLEILEIALSI